MKRFTASAIPRYQIFSLNDGTIVVQWDDKRVQELHTGNYRDFDYKTDYGRLITDYELNQLKAAHRVEHFNNQYVWIYALPENGRFGQRRVLGRGEDRIRAYYIVTTYPRPQLENVRDLMNTLKMDRQYSVRAREKSVVILGQNGVPFRDLETAEHAQQSLHEHAPDVFEGLTIAFIEFDNNLMAAYQQSSMENETNNLDLNEIIASQSDTSQITGKLIVLAIHHKEEREAFSELLANMRLEVKYASSAVQALQLLEDYHAHLLIMDIQQPDMHGWNMITKIREISHLRELPITVITDQPNLGTTVAKVDYLNRPVSIARLRHNIWTALQQLNNTQADTSESDQE